MSKVKLNQIVALNAPKKALFSKTQTALYHAFQKSDPFTGLERHYTPKDDKGESLPSESSKVQHKVENMLNEIQDTWKEMFDVVLTNDVGNCEAKADIVVDDVVILKDVPVSSLLFLDKQLENWISVINKIPTLPLSDNWNLDLNTGLYTTPPVQTVRTKKVEEPIVLYDATDKFPAQTQMVTKDVIVGTWTGKKLSSALPSTKVDELFNRVIKLKEAVIKAKELANSIDINQIKGGEEILKFIFE